MVVRGVVINREMGWWSVEARVVVRGVVVSREMGW